MKAFSERNPVTIAVVAIAVVLGLGLAVFYANDLPVIGGGDSYSANFAEASGLKSGDDVTVGGVRVGEVQSVSLAGQHVHVDFQVKDTWLGDQSTASIQIVTLLGQESLAIVPQGSRPLSGSTPIPISRTTTPLDVNAALSQLSSTVGQINTPQLESAFNALSDAFQNTPASVRTALDGLSRISHTIASRDAQLHQLADNTQKLTGTLSTNDKNVAALIADGSQLLAELRARSAAITSLLGGTRNLAQQVSGLVHDNEKTLGPALAQLSKVTTILSDNRTNLDNALRLLGPYYTLLNDTSGNGPWLDIYICGLFNSSNAPVLNATAKRNCYPEAGR